MTFTRAPAISLGVLCVGLVWSCGGDDSHASRAGIDRPRIAFCAGRASAGDATRHGRARAICGVGSYSARRAIAHAPSRQSHQPSFQAPLTLRGERSLYVLVLEYIDDPDDDPGIEGATRTSIATMRKLATTATDLESLEAVDSEPRLVWEAALGRFEQQHHDYFAEPEDAITTRNVDGDAPAELVSPYEYEVGECEVSRLAVVDALTGVVEAQFNQRERCADAPGDCENDSMTTTTHRIAFEPDASGHPVALIHKQSVMRGDEVLNESNEVEQCCLWSKEGDRFQCTPGTACNAPSAEPESP